MGSAYTPGLTVSGDVIVRRVRRLPIKGEVLVKVGDHVTSDSAVARALLPGLLQTMKIADLLGVEAKEARPFLEVKEGDKLEKGQLLCETKGFFGLGKRKVLAEFEGTIESMSDITGNMLIREAPIPVDISAYVDGKVAEVIDGEGAIIETRGALVQGIFGIGGERNGPIRCAASGPDQILEPEHIHDTDKGKILIGGAGITFSAMKKADELGVIGIIVGGIKDSDLTHFLGYDIGVAITGQEPINTTLVVTEGFGYLNMADRTFKLLQSMEGRTASINGATQIRAGVIRPEMISPDSSLSGDARAAGGALELKIGTPIRVIREPYFGRLGTVTGLPAQLMVVESGTEVRVLQAKLDNGDEALVPRANVEIIAT
ncbi:MAG: hypothetical protein JNJ45_00615 [Chthonomonas sp.]|nr:hypothetical protein [Chthonomonas sp.]